MIKRISEIEKEKTCLQCNRSFYSIHSKAKYCSQSCSRLAKKKVRGTVRCCHQCKNDFEPKKAGQRFCSVSCSTSATKRKHKYTCLFCQTEYTAKTIDRNKYCSRECAFEHKKELSKQRVALKEQNKYIQKTCVVCGKEFNCDRKNKKCCSDLCAKTYYKNNNKLKCIELKSKKYPTSVCVCGKAFLPKYGDKRRTYCSAKCANKYLSKTGKHKRKARLKLLDRTLAAKDWREALSYFKNKCAYCGKESDKPLHQDHFVPLSKGGEYTKNNIVPACFDCNVSKSNKSFNEWYANYNHGSIFLKNKLIKYLRYNEKDYSQQLSLCI